MQHQFISLNGIMVPASEPHFISTNRALRYGDGLFEGMRIHNGEFLFFEDHILRLLSGMKSLGFIIPDHFSSAYFYKTISKLLISNKVAGNCVVRIQVYRTDAGLYEPLSDEVDFFVESFNPSIEKYELNKKGIIVSVFQEWKKDFSPAMNFKTCNSQVYVMASRWKLKENLDDVLILNSNENIADATSSNVFIWKQSKLITPALSEACIGGVVRKNIVEFSKAIGIEVEERSIAQNEILEADEMFLTNISKGIRWVEFFKEKKFGNSKTQNLCEKFYSKILQVE